MKKNSMYQNGFTLIEMMIVVIILGIIAAYAIPSFTSMISRQHVKKGASEIVNAINQGRSQAALTSKNATISISTDKRSFSVTFPNKDDPTKPYITTQYRLEDRLSIATNMTSDVIALSSGKLSYTTTGNKNLTFRVCDSDFNEEQGYTIWINAMGMAGGATGPVTGKGDDNISNLNCNAVI